MFAWLNNLFTAARGMVYEKEGSVAIRLEVSKAVDERLGELQEKIDAKGYAEIFRYSLAVYDFLIDEKDKGNKTFILTPEGYKEVIILTPRTADLGETNLKLVPKD